MSSNFSHFHTFFHFFHFYKNCIFNFKKIIDWFGSEEPLSGFGKMILGESLILSGKSQIEKTKGKSNIRKIEKQFKGF